MKSTSLLYGDSLVDDVSCPVLDTAHMSGRLTNSQFISIIDTQLQYLPVQQREDVSNLLLSHSSILQDVPSQTHLLEHNVHVGATSPIKQYSYLCPPIKRETMRKECQYLLDNGLAKPSHSSLAPHVYWYKIKTVQMITIK